MEMILLTVVLAFVAIMWASVLDDSKVAAIVIGVVAFFVLLFALVLPGDYFEGRDMRVVELGYYADSTGTIEGVLKETKKPHKTATVYEYIEKVTTDDGVRYFPKTTGYKDTVTIIRSDEVEVPKMMISESGYDPNRWTLSLGQVHTDYVVLIPTDANFVENCNQIFEKND